MNQHENDKLSTIDDNEEKDDEFQEKLDFEENEIIDESTKDVSSITITSNDSEEEGLVKDKSSEIKIDKSSEIKIDKSNIINLRSIKAEDGELNDDEDSDNDLEEGELKEDDDPINQSLDYLINKRENENKKKIPCKFYSNGFCTWGHNCRFGHSGPVKFNNNNFNKLGTNRVNQHQNYFPKQQQQYNKYNNEYDNRTNLESRLDYDDQDNRREMYSLRDKGFYNQSTDKDYERKRRLAFESAPWNNQTNLDQHKGYRKSTNSSNQIDNDYNDQIYKSPKDHSSSSSFTVADFSSSDSEKNYNQQLNRNFDEKKRKYSGDNLDKQSPDQPPLNYQPHYSSRRHKYDEDENSTSSSFFTDSGSFINDDIKPKKYDRSRSSSPTTYPRKRSKSREHYHRSKEDLRKTIEAKQSSNKFYSSKSYHQSTSTSSRKRSKDREEEKKPIKMIFKRKQSSLKKGVELNGSRDEFESEGNEEEFDLYGGKCDVISKKIDNNYSRDDLLKRLKEIDEAIAKKRSKQA